MGRNSRRKTRLTGVGLSILALSASAGSASATQPISDELRSYYPAQAAAAGLDGEATLQCNITPQLVLRNCRLKSENPVGVGFGEAALRLAKLSRPNPRAQLPALRGAPMRFNFTYSPMAITPNTLKPLAVVRNPDWVRQPTPEELSAAFPMEATAAAGHAIVGCRVAVNQTLTDCSVLQEAPPAQGFGQAALGLTTVIRLTPKTYDDEPVAGQEVRIPFAFVR